MLLSETKLWLNCMTYEERCREIADILLDYDGYRSAEDLMGLIDEVREYAKYPIAREYENLEATVQFWKDADVRVEQYLSTLVANDLDEWGALFDTFLLSDLPTVKRWCEENGCSARVIYLHPSCASSALVDVVIERINE